MFLDFSRLRFLETSSAASLSNLILFCWSRFSLDFLSLVSLCVVINSLLAFSSGVSPFLIASFSALFSAKIAFLVFSSRALAACSSKANLWPSFSFLKTSFGVFW